MIYPSLDLKIENPNFRKIITPWLIFRKTNQLKFPFILMNLSTKSCGRVLFKLYENPFNHVINDN